MRTIFFSAIIVLLCCSAAIIQPQKPTLYLIGDSTVDTGNGDKGLWGWGKYLPIYFDLSRIDIKNYAKGGTSSRTFQTNGLPEFMKDKRGMWDSVSVKLRKGDFLMIQFGLNDQAAINDTSRARGTLKGVGNDSVKIINGLTRKKETVHTYGWYLRRFINVAKAKGVTVIVCSSIPRNRWQNGKLIRGEEGFGSWAMQVAKDEKVFSIDLNTLIANEYDKEGEAAVTQKYHIEKDITHTTERGALLNAFLVVKGVQGQEKCKLNNYLKK